MQELRLDRVIEGFDLHTENYSTKGFSSKIDRSSSTIFSMIDLTVGVWQMLLHPKSRPNTAFIFVGMGQFQWVTSPKGHWNPRPVSNASIRPSSMAYPTSLCSLTNYKCTQSLIKASGYPQSSVEQICAYNK